MAKQSENLEIEEEVFVKFRSMIDSINDGLNKSKAKVTPETEPSFMRTPGSSN